MKLNISGLMDLPLPDLFVPKAKVKQMDLVNEAREETEAVRLKEFKLLEAKNADLKSRVDSMQGQAFTIAQSSLIKA